MTTFSFGFSGDDIEHDQVAAPLGTANNYTEPKAPVDSSAGAFPVLGKPQLPPTHHLLPHLLSQLPSKIAYSITDVALDDGTLIRIPRRELWDIRVQLMAEEGNVNTGTGGATTDGGSISGSGLDKYDVKTGIYEGGFKSWESSLDLVKVLATERLLSNQHRPHTRIIELGCGTALPSTAVFHWALKTPGKQQPVSFILADYNPSVLQLVTLPNFILMWALISHNKPDFQKSLAAEGELELSSDVLEAFQTFLSESQISLSFISGAWSLDFVQLLYDLPVPSADVLLPTATLILGAETIYSPFALRAFAETVFTILEREQYSTGTGTAALIAAKRLYFGVGGSLDDFVDVAQARGGIITHVREETEGVKRGVVRCVLNTEGAISPTTSNTS